MDNAKGISRFIKNEWITISVTILTLALYLGITSHSIHGMIGFVVLNFTIFSIIGNLLYTVLGYKMQRLQGIILTIFSSVILIVQILKEGIIERLDVLGCITGIILLIFMWSVLEQTKSLTTRIAVIFVFLGLFVSISYIWFYSGTFTPDSYAYYEIAQTIGKDFGKIETIRQYTIKSDYNCSFPYFYPLCIFVIDKLTALGRYSGILLNFYIMLFTGVLFIGTSKKMTSKTWCGGMAFFLLATTNSYLEELCAGRAIPLALFLGVCAFCLLAEAYYFKKEQWFIFIVIGLLNGMLITTRFDGLVMMLYCGLLVLLCGKNRIKKVAAYGAGVLVMALPWAVYSVKHFGKIWISDNGGTPFLVHTTVPTRVNLPGNEALTLFNAPEEWFQALLQKMNTIFISVRDCSWLADVVIIVSFILIIIALCKRKVSQNSLIVLCVSVVFYLGKTAMYILVGYKDIRYHVETVVVIAFIFMMICAKNEFKIGKKIIIVTVVCVELLLAVFSFKDEATLILENRAMSALDRVETAPDWIVSINEDLNNVIKDKDSEILYLKYGYTFAGWTDWKIYVDPEPSELSTIQYAMENYMDVEYVFIPTSYPKEEVIDYFKALYPSTMIQNYILFEVGE